MTQTEQQKKTLEMLASRIDNIEVVEDADLPGELAFAGDGVDGLEVGNIAPDGKISWIVGG